jgi:hypothetical protein
MALVHRTIASHLISSQWHGILLRRWKFHDFSCGILIARWPPKATRDATRQAACMPGQVLLCQFYGLVPGHFGKAAAMRLYWRQYEQALKVDELQRAGIPPSFWSDDNLMMDPLPVRISASTHTRTHTFFGISISISSTTCAELVRVRMIRWHCCLNGQKDDGGGCLMYARPGRPQ